MDDIRLEAVNRDNWEELISLEVAPEQSHFIATNQYSLAEAYALPEMRPLAVYAGNLVVGFVMYCLDKDDGCPWIHRIMIAADHQRKGYGRAALRLAIERIKSEYDPGVIALSFEPDNETARKLYQSEGFVVTDEMIWGEVVARLYLK